MKQRFLSFTDKTYIMGVLNITSDSFSDGGEYFSNIEKATNRACQMVKEGAEIIDVGGESSRPGSHKVSSVDQIKRVVPVILEIKKKIPQSILISVDTNNSNVAEAALKSGANMVNSMGGFSFDDKLQNVLAKHQCSIVAYHIHGKPSSMQEKTNLEYDVMNEISSFFKSQLATARKSGINIKKVILDPGIGFGKSLEQNLTIIRRLSEFNQFNLPLLVGISRKGHLGTILKEELKLSGVPSPKERLEVALAETAFAVFNGANIIRTHDVLQTKKFIITLNLLREVK